MKAKEKAKELVDRFYKVLTKGYAGNDLAQIFADSMWYEEAKQCALICVDEIIESHETKKAFKKMYPIEFLEYWQEVKQEIEKL